jgi:hypothetical protein
MSESFKPLLAVIKLGTNTIGSGYTETSSLSFKREVDEHYGLGDDGKPTLVKGNKHYKGKLSKAYIDKTYGELVLAGTAVDIVFYPEGTATGKQTVTCKNAILHDWDLKQDQKTIVLEDIAFTGNDLVFGTAT